MLRGKLPDFGYGCDLVVAEKPTICDLILEKLNFEELAKQNRQDDLKREKSSRMGTNMGKYRSLSRFNTSYKNSEYENPYKRDVENLKAYHKNIDSIISLVKRKKNKKITNFKLSFHSPQPMRTGFEEVEPRKKNIFRNKQVRDYPGFSIQKTLTLKSKIMSPISAGSLSGFSPAVKKNHLGDDLFKTFENDSSVSSREKPHNVKLSVKRMVRIQNNKLRKTRRQANSSKQVNDIRSKGHRRVNSIKRRNKNNQYDSITRLMSKHFSQLDVVKPTLNRKQKIFFKFSDQLKKDYQNELAKNAMFRWCSNPKSSSRDLKDFRSLETPRDVKIVKSTLRSLKKSPLPDLSRYSRRNRDLNNQGNQTYFSPIPGSERLEEIYEEKPDSPIEMAHTTYAAPFIPKSI